MSVQMWEVKPQKVIVIENIPENRAIIQKFFKVVQDMPDQSGLYIAKKICGLFVPFGRLIVIFPNNTFKVTTDWSLGLSYQLMGDIQGAALESIIKDFRGED